MIRAGYVLIFGTVLWVSSTNVALSQTPETLAQEASAAMRSKNYSLAAQRYQNLVKLMPQAGELHSNLGLAYFFDGRPDLAEQSFREALRHAPNLFVPNFFLGRIFFETSRFDEAVKFLETAYRVGQNTEMVTRFLAASLVGIGRHGEAIEYYLKLLRKNPADIESLYAVSRLYMALGQQAYNRLKDFPESAFYTLVDAEFNAERPRWFEVAKKRYQEAIQTAPNTPDLRTSFGMFLLRSGDLEPARSAFQEELTVDENSYEALFGLGVVELCSGDPVSAARRIEAAAANRPEFFDPLPQLPIPQSCSVQTLDTTKLGGSEAKTGFGAAYLAAMADLKAGIQVQPSRISEVRNLLNEISGRTTASMESQATNSVNLALDLLRKKRFENGIPLLRLEAKKNLADPEIGPEFVRAISLAGSPEDLLFLHLNESPKSAEYLYRTGAGFKRLALETMERLVEVAPESARAHQLLGDSHLGREQFRDAVQEYRQAADARPNDGELKYSLAEAYCGIPEYEEALKVLEEVLALDPRHADAALLKGSSLLALRKPDEALGALELAISLDPGLLDAHALLGESLALLGRTERAIHHLQLAAESDEDGALHYRLFSLYRKLGKTDLANAARAKSLELRKLAAEKEQSNQ